MGRNPNMRITAILTGGAIGLALASTALAAPEGKRGRFDSTAAVTRADTLAMASQRFDRIDTNKDGMIDAAEMAAHQDTMQERRGKRMAARAAARTDETPAETTDAATTARREARAKLARARAEARSAQAEYGFAMRDADGDGMITRDEFTAPALKRFDRADADADGIVTPEERAAMRQSRRASRS
jgi:hypothetical protein